jgi:hypothetical protein
MWPGLACGCWCSFPIHTLPIHHIHPLAPLSCPAAGYLQLDLVDATGLAGDPLAKCLASVKVNLGSDCAISLTPLSSGGSYVPGIWADATGVDTYSKLRECPVTTGTAVAGAETAAGRVAALETAFENFVYGSDKVVSATLAFSAAGTVTVTTTGPLTYAITKVSAALRLLPILLLPPE